MPPTPFGERLKREREMRGVSLEEVSVATRIAPKYLEALESEQWDQLPGGAFNRGFIRTIARFLGMDEESILGEYAITTKDRQAAAGVRDDVMDLPDRRWVAVAVLAVLLVILIAAGWFLYRRFGKPLHMAKKTQASQLLTSSAAPASPSTAADPPQKSAPASSADRHDAAGAMNSNMLALKIEAGRDAAITVVADGQSAYSGPINAGETQRYRARNSFEISATDSSAVLIEMNGQIMPPLGTPGQAGTATFTQEDLKPATGGNR
ncbi:MAG: RodZ domain-containing protein [Candidatus Acidiferrales bacterium]